MNDKIVDFEDARKKAAGEAPEAETIAIAGGPIDECGVSLCVYGDDLVPDDVSTLLGVDPTRSGKKGDYVPRGRHAPKGRRRTQYRTGVWILTLRGEAPTGPSTLLEQLFEQLPDSGPVWTELSSRFRVKLNFGFHMVGWNRGFDLSPDLVKMISDTHAEVGFDIYAYGDEDE